MPALGSALQRFLARLRGFSLRRALGRIGKESLLILALAAVSLGLDSLMNDVTLGKIERSVHNALRNFNPVDIVDRYAVVTGAQPPAENAEQYEGCLRAHHWKQPAIAACDRDYMRPGPVTRWLGLEIGAQFDTDRKPDIASLVIGLAAGLIDLLWSILWQPSIAGRIVNFVEVFLAGAITFKLFKAFAAELPAHPLGYLITALWGFVFFLGCCGLVGIGIDGLGHLTERLLHELGRISKAVSDWLQHRAFLTSTAAGNLYLFVKVFAEKGYERRLEAFLETGFEHAADFGRAIMRRILGLR